MIITIGIRPCENFSYGKAGLRHIKNRFSISYKPTEKHGYEPAAIYSITNAEIVSNLMNLKII
jgi:hypothetical protein